MTFEEKQAEYFAAREREEEARVIAFADVAYPLFGGRYWVRALTPRDMVRLQMAKCSLICGGRITKRDVFNFMVQQMDLRGGRALFKRISLRRFIAKTADDVLAREVMEHIDLILRDRVLHERTEDDGGAAEFEPRPVFWAANQAALFMREFHFSFADYMATPCPILNQLKRDIVLNAGHSAAAIDESETIKAEAAEILAKEAAEYGN